jgi:hypothetical protein
MHRRRVGSGRLIDLAAADFNLYSVGAGEAAEEGDYHAWDEGSRVDDEAFD